MYKEEQLEILKKNIEKEGIPATDFKDLNSETEEYIHSIQSESKINKNKVISLLVNAVMDVDLSVPVARKGIETS